MSSLIKFEKLSKIYSSNNSVAIGLRNINLELNLGEFVTITGSSGSGKTTLLNVLSGMDSYEEGEFFFNNEPTSYFSQKDWEEYRLKNISFIFQDYNILDSFTVLENVEFALLHIEDIKKRRQKALELIKKVGLSSHIHHRGSKLSGGQKQRTVIARALAKDSPIILADEPTGNLDSHSAKEIVSLLKNISKDKLVVVVTHNEEQFEDVATRKIKLFDGQISSDVEISSIEKQEYKNIKLPSLKNEFLTGIHLGFKRFKAKPKLSSFLTIMLFVALLGIFAITSSNFNSLTMNKPLFTHYNGRVVITKYDNTPITDEDMKKLVKDEAYIIDDIYFDTSSYVTLENNGYYSSQKAYNFNFNYDKSLDAGRLPKNINEVVLYGPKCDLDLFKNALNKEIRIANLPYSIWKVVGYKAILDNTKAGNIYFTKEGYEYFAMINRISSYNYNEASIFTNTTYMSYSPMWFASNTIQIDFTLKKGEVKVLYSNENQNLTQFDELTLYTPNTLTLKVDKVIYEFSHQQFDEQVYISVYDAQELYDTYYINNDKQVSIFYKNDSTAKKNISKFQDLGYCALGSYETVKSTDITEYIYRIFNIILWVFIVWFFSIFMNLCTRRSINSTKNDIAIFRSMGINKKVIKISTFAHITLCAIVSLLLLFILTTTLFTIPSTNATFNYVQPIGYLYMVLAVALIVLFIARNFNKKLFNESIRKNLRRDEK